MQFASGYFHTSLVPRLGLHTTLSAMNSNYRRQIVLLLAIAFTIRLAAGWVWQSRLDGRFAFGDSESYWQLARAVAEGRPYVYGVQNAQVFRTPGYPILLAPIFRITDDELTALLLARAEAALFGTLAVLGVWWVASLLFDRRTALLAMMIAVVYPGGIAMSVLVLSEAPFCPIMLLQLGLCILAWKSATGLGQVANLSYVGRGTAWAFTAGLAGGAATLMRPDWLLFTPAAAVVLIVFPNRKLGATAGLSSSARKSRLANTAGQASSGTQFRQPLKQHVAVAFCMILGLIVAMAPWWMRNARVTGRFVPTTLQVGASLYDGLNPQATGASEMSFVDRFIAEERAESGVSPDEVSIRFEERLDRRMRDESVSWARENPGETLRLAGEKFLRMWNFWPNEERMAAWPVRLGLFLAYTPLLIFAIMGAVRTIRRGWPYIICWLPAAYLTSLHLVFVSSIRYRMPVMLALLPLAAAEIFYWIDKRGVGTRDSGL